MAGLVAIEGALKKTFNLSEAKKGALRLNTKICTIIQYVETASVTKDTFRLLQKLNPLKNTSIQSDSPWAIAQPKELAPSEVENVDEVLPNLISEVEEIQRQSEEMSSAVHFVQMRLPSVDRPRDLSPLKKMEPKVDTSSPAAPPSPPKQSSEEEDVFLQFLALAERIQHQAETEAQDLYQKMKFRTDCVELLTLLLQKIKASKGDVDWSKNEEMKKLIDRAREIGVVIPGEVPGQEPKYKWKSSELKNLEDNIKLCKNSIDQATLLERTYMQKHLQEAAQWLEAMSGILKLRDRIMQTLASNISR